MKKTGLPLTILAVLALTAGLSAQSASPAILGQEPTYSDMYCAGFLTNQLISQQNFVAGGWGTPDSTKYADRDYVYLSGGGYQEGAQYSILRRVLDPNKWEPYKGYRRAAAAVGEAYAEVGWVKIVGTRGDIGIAEVGFACDGMIPGDLAVPFVEKTTPQIRPAAAFDRFAMPSGLMTARIVMAREFDYLAATGHKLYLNVGSNQGVKVGDYFRAVRDYRTDTLEEIDALAYKASIPDDTQKMPPTFPKRRLGEFPRRNLGEMVVLNVTPSSSTAMVTYAIEDILVGDVVEMMEPAPPVPPAPMNPPTISCRANPVTVQMGERSNIICEAASPDDRPLTMSHAASAGTVSPQNGDAILETYSASPGSISVRSTATDDRNLSASAMTLVNVEAPPPPAAASKVNEIQFRRNSAYVDNRAKAILDDLALRLEREPDSTTAVIASVEAKERGGEQLATRRAENTRAYLATEKGIDASRVRISTAGEAGRKADLWVVPAGAAEPQ